MRPTTVTVGPLAAASDVSICPSQTPTGAGQLVFATTHLTGLATAQISGTTSAQITGSISGNVLTVTSVPLGIVRIGQALNGAGILAGTVVTNTLTGTGGAGTYIVNLNQTFSSGTIYADPKCTLDTPRRVLLTTAADESAVVFTITGIGHNSEPQTELMTGPALATVQMSTMDFLQIGSISASAATSGAVKFGTNQVASSNWIRLDEYAPGIATLQTTVVGTANYTVQVSMDDPNSPTNPVLPYLMNWGSSLDTNVVAATASKVSYFTNSPLWARVTLNSESGAGSVALTLAQSSNAPY